MRLALISHGRPDDPRHFSGIPWHVLQELRRQGHVVEACHAEPDSWTRHWAQFKHRLSLKFSGQPHHFEADPWILRTRSISLDKKIRAFAPDAVLCVGFPEVACALSPSLPLYVWMDAFYQTVRRNYAYFRDYYSKNDAHRLQQIEDRVLRRAKKIWLSSKWAADEAEADFPRTAWRIGVQSFGANLDNPPSSAEVEQFISARDLAAPTFLFLANEWERKGGAAAVETVKHLRGKGIPAKLVVVGLNERPTTIPPEPWLEWVGRLDKNSSEDNRRLKRYFADSAFLLLPTTADCTPIVCLEAAAYGLPVLSTTVGGLASTVDSGITGMLWPVENFTDEAPNWLKPVLTDRKRYIEMAHAARHRYETTGNWMVNVRAVAAEIAKSTQLASA